MSSGILTVVVGSSLTFFLDWPGWTLVWPVRVLSSLKNPLHFSLSSCDSTVKNQSGLLKNISFHLLSLALCYMMFYFILELTSISRWSFCRNRKMMKIGKSYSSILTFCGISFIKKSKLIAQLLTAVKYNPRSLIISSLFNVFHEPWRVYYFRCGGFFWW